MPIQMLHFHVRLKSHKDNEIRTRMLTKLEQNPLIDLKTIAEEI